MLFVIAATIAHKIFVVVVGLRRAHQRCRDAGVVIFRAALGEHVPDATRRSDSRGRAHARVARRRQCDVVARKQGRRRSRTPGSATTPAMATSAGTSLLRAMYLYYCTSSSVESGVPGRRWVAAFSRTRTIAGVRTVAAVGRRWWFEHCRGCTHFHWRRNHQPSREPGKSCGGRTCTATMAKRRKPARVSVILRQYTSITIELYRNPLRVTSERESTSKHKPGF